MSRQKTAYLVLCAFLLVLLPHAAAAAAGCGALPEWFTGVPSIPTFEPRNTCQFQQWAWQAFLALLQTDGSQQTPLYFTWPLPKNSIYDLYCERVCHSDARLPPNPCNPPTQKEFVNATTQPGFVSPTTSGELIDQAGKPVYFTSHVSPEWVDFITRRQLYDNQVLESANPHLAFRAGAFEIKTSWRFTSGMSPAEKAQYYTTTACVAPEDHSTPFPAELALVGFHITGGAPGHPRAPLGDLRARPQRAGLRRHAGAGQVVVLRRQDELPDPGVQSAEPERRQRSGQRLPQALLRRREPADRPPDRRPQRGGPQPVAARVEMALLRSDRHRLGERPAAAVPGGGQSRAVRHPACGGHVDVQPAGALGLTAALQHQPGDVQTERQLLRLPQRSVPRRVRLDRRWLAGDLPEQESLREPRRPVLHLLRGGRVRAGLPHPAGLAGKSKR
jgi:hypothetical protein